MPRIRQEFDADLIRTNLPTEHETDLNQFELPCGVCGRHIFVDKPTLENYERSLQYDLENQFICYECEREYEDLAYE